MFRENVFNGPSELRALQQLDAELRRVDTARLRPLRRVDNAGAPAEEVAAWNERILAPFRECTWLSAPWCVAEFYFYRRVAAAVRYFRTGRDPFRAQKEWGVMSAVALGSFERLSARVNAAVDGLSSPDAHGGGGMRMRMIEREFKLFILTSLWGNRMDLSLWPVGSSRGDDDGGGGDGDAGSFEQVLRVGERRLLADDSHALWQYIERCMQRAAAVTAATTTPASSSSPPPTPLRTVGIVVDNAGFELFCDMALADFLIAAGLAQRVMFHVKWHPTFVSDAMAKDLRWTVEYLLGDGTGAGNARLAARCKSYLERGAWVCREDAFWVQPQAFWEMDERSELYRELVSSHDLVIVKGDANYRRLLGDRDWPLDTPFDAVACYWPTPLCALRTLKAEIGCGMPRRSVERAVAEEPGWLVSGNWAVVQCVV